MLLAFFSKIYNLLILLFVDYKFQVVFHLLGYGPWTVLTCLALRAFVLEISLDRELKILLTKLVVLDEAGTLLSILASSKPFPSCVSFLAVASCEHSATRPSNTMNFV
jgi:hypothetical protein